MKSMKQLAILISMVSATAFSVNVLAQATMEPGKMGDMKMMSGNDMVQGEIRKIDKEASKITIKHGEIKNLEMPPMTMVFTVKDKALLDKVQTGDKVRFNVVREDGKMVVTEIQVAK